MRIDIQNKIKVESGGICIIQMEKMQYILEQLTGKSFDEYSIMKIILDAGGDCTSMEPYQDVNIGKMYTLNKDGSNTTLIRLAPIVPEFKRMLKSGEQTCQEYCMQKRKESNINSYQEGLVDFLVDQMKNYKKEMLGEE